MKFGLKPVKGKDFLLGGFVQAEPFTARRITDGNHGWSLVIPLPRQRALRVGMNFRAWCKLGPRRYKVVASPEFVESFERLLGGTKDDIRAMGVEIQGDLKVVQDDGQHDE